MMETVSSARKEHIEYLIDETLSFVFNRCQEDGFDLGAEKCSKTTAMLIESLRSALFDSVGIEHPLQPVAEKMFQIVENIEGQISINPSSFVVTSLEDLADKE
jgi:hypothetical protein